MACVDYVWTDDRRPEVEAALRESYTLVEAAKRLGATEPALRGVVRKWGIDYPSLFKKPERVTVPEPALAAPEPAPVEWTGARPASTGVGLRRIIALSDTHFPVHLLRACAGVIGLAKAIQPHEILHLGDAWNNGAISRHPRPFGGRDNHRGAQVQGLAFFDALARAAPGARRRLLMGNHDDWALEFEDEHPEFSGMFAAKWMGLDRLGWEIVSRDAQPLVIGPVDFAHGTGGGEHYAKRYALHADTGARVHIRAHHHSMQHFRAKNGHECWGTGFLGDRRSSAFSYCKERGHWETGCLVIDILGDHVTVTPVHIENGAALFGGRLITQERAA